MVPPVYFVMAGELHRAQTKFENPATFDKPFVLAVCRCNRSVKKIVKNNFQPVEVRPYLFFWGGIDHYFPAFQPRLKKSGRVWRISKGTFGYSYYQTSQTSTVSFFLREWKGRNWRLESNKKRQHISYRRNRARKRT